MEHGETKDLDWDRQVKYFTRCLRSGLPEPYTAGDSTKLSLAFFTVTGLDLLDALPGVSQTVSSSNAGPDEEAARAEKAEKERAGWIDWIYSHLRPGSRGFVGTMTFETTVTKMSTSAGDAEVPCEEVEGAAGLSVTLFALLTLVVLGDDLSRIDRRGMAAWLVSLQAPSGGFWDYDPLQMDVRMADVTAGKSADKAGSVDCRFCYCAAGIRYLIRSWETGIDIDVDAAAKFVESCFTYDGGFAESPGKEAHAGYTYCALAALSLLDRLPPSSEGSQSLSSASTTSTISTVNLDLLTHWLVSRQVASTLPPEPDDYTDSKGNDEGNGRILTAAEQERIRSEASDQPDCWRGQCSRAGFQGRVNKRPDTCYSFWIGASLEIIDRGSLKNSDIDIAWLLRDTQSARLGGFSKVQGDYPDILHSALGLAALALSAHSKTDNKTSSSPDITRLQPFNPVLCLTSRAKDFHNRISFRPHLVQSPPRQTQSVPSPAEAASTIS